MKSTTKYDFVYILKDTEENEELKYSIRSVEKNAKHLINRIVFVGGNPKGFKNIYHIDGYQNFNNKHKNAIMSIYAACKNPYITDEFILMNDDFYIQHPISDIGITYGGTMLDRITELPDGAYKLEMLKARDFIKYAMLDQEPMNYAVHHPIKIVKNCAETCIRTIEPAHNFRNLYGNLYRLMESNSTKPYQLKDNKLRQQDNGKFDKQAPFLSSDDDTFDELKAYLKEIFSEKSQYEI